MYHNSFIHSSVNGYLSGFHVLTITDSAAMNNGIHVSLSFWFLQGIRLGVGLLGHMAVLSEKAMAPHSSTLAQKIPWMEEPGRLQSMGSRRVGHD